MNCILVQNSCPSIHCLESVWMFLVVYPVLSIKLLKGYDASFKANTYFCRTVNFVGSQFWGRGPVNFMMLYQPGVLNPGFQFRFIRELLPSDLLITQFGGHFDI